MKLSKLLKEALFDKYIFKVKTSDYTGTIKRSPKGWVLYDENGSAEEAGRSFNTLTSLLSHYDIDKKDLSGGDVGNLKEDEVDEMSSTGAGGSFTPGSGEQFSTNRAFVGGSSEDRGKKKKKIDSWNYKPKK